ncbi:hypothetical protein KOR42_23370 [Thalassoglobus neptunius]|uniref:Uncharacterized protein n=1 Tax=Thalassoglobus neptunius TaxID=1938619 RepID=A0A5C5X7L6_9PLAN|nr:hypothetical protein [Thalassoglobus neptunius]TWT58950.1 hypothetical protein KOR42_23370 [Thalassoglobus neptunius]
MRRRSRKTPRSWIVVSTINDANGTWAKLFPTEDAANRFAADYIREHRMQRVREILPFRNEELHLKPIEFFSDGELIEIHVETLDNSEWLIVIPEGFHPETRVNRNSSEQTREVSGEWNMESEKWLICEKSPGQFSSEYAVAIKTFDGASVSGFASIENVIVGDDGVALVKVDVVHPDRGGQMVLVEPYMEMVEGGSFVTVANDQLRDI